MLYFANAILFYQLLSLSTKKEEVEEATMNTPHVAEASTCSLEKNRILEQCSYIGYMSLGQLPGSYRDAFSNLHCLQMQRTHHVVQFLYLISATYLYCYVLVQWNFIWKYNYTSRPTNIWAYINFQVSNLMENEMANKFYSTKILSTGLLFQDIGKNYEIRDF